jgi:hypothetical protein
MWKRRLKILTCVFLAPIVLLFLFLIFERVRGKISLARYEKFLVQHGEKLNPKDFNIPFSETDNGAPEIQRAAGELKEG